jgi:hypothetical protein
LIYVILIYKNMNNETFLEDNLIDQPLSVEKAKKDTDQQTAETFLNMGIKGEIKDLTSVGYDYQEARFGPMRNGQEMTPLEIDGQEVLYIPEHSTSQKLLAENELGISSGFYKCCAVLCLREEKLLFVHNTSNSPSTHLKVNVLFQLGIIQDRNDWVKIKQVINQGEPEKTLQQKNFDEILIVGTDPHQLQAYFSQSSDQVRTHTIEADSGEPFTVWSKLENGKIKAGVLRNDGTKIE